MKNVLLLASFAMFFIYDIYLGVVEGIPISHVWHEVMLFLAACVAIVFHTILLFRKDARIKSLNFELLETQRSYREWKEKIGTSAKQIRDSIDHQFELWHLSHSEKDIALLLIKGFSMKEIAEIRQTHEKTVRHQATIIYKKSALSGRQELAAFFLEDILSTPTEAI